MNMLTNRFIVTSALTGVTIAAAAAAGAARHPVAFAVIGAAWAVGATLAVVAARRQARGR
jgi:hypothetical protein